MIDAFLSGARASSLLSSRRPSVRGLQVEIAWRGKVERTFFPLPFEVKYLSDATKAKFLEEVRKRTAFFAELNGKTSFYLFLTCVCLCARVRAYVRVRACVFACLRGCVRSRVCNR